MKRRQLLTGIGGCMGMLILILDGRTALSGARQGVELCLKTVIPSLFPFFVLSILLTSSLPGSRLPLLRPLGRLCGVAEGAESLLIPAFLGGYPVGAQSVAEAFRSGQLSRPQAERLLAFCNNAGPAFLFGMAGSMFPRKWMAWTLWGIHIAGAVFTALVIPGSSGETAAMPTKAPLSPAAALSSAVKVMASVCGWVMLFRVLLAFLSRWLLWILPAAAQVVVAGVLELSNGCCELMAVSDVSVRFCICAGILAFGGLCVAMQTASVTGGLSLRLYFLGKTLQTAFSLALAWAVSCGTWLPFGILFLLFLGAKLQKKQKKSRFPSASGV